MGCAAALLLNKKRRPATLIATCGSGYTLDGLQALNGHCTWSACFTGLPGLAWASRFARVCAINNTAFGFTPDTRATGLTRLAAGTTLNQHLDLLVREITRQFDPHLSTCCALVAIAAVITIGT